MLEIQNLHKSFGKEVVLKGLSARFDSAICTSLLGSSGVGKTSLLKIIAGLDQADGGDILWNGNSILSLKPEQRRMVYMSQEALLFPHLSVEKNVAFPMEIKKSPEGQIKNETVELLEAVGIADMKDKKPQQLSGGQKQRVAFARALAAQPEILLLDEPFAALDPDARAEMQNLFIHVTEQRELTSIFVTHDLKEALKVGEKVGILEEDIHIYDSASEFATAHPERIDGERSFWNKL